MGILFVSSLSGLIALALAYIVYLRSGSKVDLAFFHPYCSHGGGGERVLWKILSLLPKDLSVIIYTIDVEADDYKEKVIKDVKRRFSIDISPELNLNFVHLSQYEHFLRPSPYLSLLLESIGTMRLAFAGLRKQSAKVYFDTTGCAFTYLVAVVMGCKVMAYVHYPTISTDMLQLVRDRRRSAYNRDPEATTNSLTSFLKLIYYRFFAFLYGCVGSLCSVVLVNSSWTHNHIASLWWGARKRIRTVFPPCSVPELETTTGERQQAILSIGQFRPEKDHLLQLEALAKVFEKKTQLRKTIRLVMLGSCRNESDNERLDIIRRKAKDLEILDSVDFVVNEPYSVVKEWLQRASIGIHTMWNEHFGIGIVEMMAAGMLVIAHNSGGPKSDIVDVGKNRTGYLASTDEEYANAIITILDMKASDQKAIRTRAIESSKRFSDEVFDSQMKIVLQQLVRR